MINMPDAVRGVAEARQLTPDLGFGLHINLTAGPPVAPSAEISSLVTETGTFLPRAKFLSELASIDPAHASHEIQAQVQRFIDVFGAPPDHLDSHHHATYMAPMLFEPMLQSAQQFNIPIRNAVPRNRDTALELLITAEAREHAEVWLNAMIAKLASSGVPAPDHFLVDFFAERTTLGDLLNLLLGLDEGTTELMCHPAIMDEILANSSGYVAERERELESLTHPSVRELLESEEVQLISFGEL
jgi:predicted glycoside hydrolase/deacetylase ChbG (UPF0249 family)